MLARHLTALALAAITLAACLSNSGDGTVDSETHFLIACDSDDACSTDRECICGVCSTPCDTTDACTAASASSACVDATSIGCAAGADVTLCLGICLSDSDCSGLGLTCADGLCVEQDATVLPDVLPDVIDGADVQDDAADSMAPPVDTSGPGVACERCGESSDCPGELVCGPWGGSGEPGAIASLICGAPTASLQAECESFCQASCGGLDCGSSTGGCICGSCPTSSMCSAGACVDETQCGNADCNDVLGVGHCVGSQFERTCPAGASTSTSTSTSTCTCAATGPVCDDICGPSTLAALANIGDVCVADDQCATDVCTANICTESSGGFGAPCSAGEQCAGDGVCLDGVCYEPCDATNTDCADGTICYVPGAFAGFCVEQCDRCDTPCTDGLCGFIWDSNGSLGCVPPSLGTAASCSLRCSQLCFDAGATCGSVGTDCYCGDCESDAACNGGTCSDACDGEPCTDGFNSAFCEGTTSTTSCGLSSGFQSCLCTAAGPECDEDCGPLGVAGGTSYGTACNTGADCATGECSFGGICGPGCMIGIGSAPLYGCPEGFLCVVPGAASGHCLKECASDGECYDGTECLQMELAPPGTTVCRLP